MTALFGLMAPPPRRIIEFGCGTGWLSLVLAQRGCDVVGVDISADAIRHAEAARVERRQERARFVAADYETFATPAPSDYALFLAWAGRLAGGGTHATTASWSSGNSHPPMRGGSGGAAVSASCRGQRTRPSAGRPKWGQR
ncbi:MAG: class I SAM-dependent methyltransferase [Opitutales bacterium]|nr:class I SAM-dependent methyltransferase [Opitutales bacterium]